MPEPISDYVIRTAYQPRESSRYCFCLSAHQKKLFHLGIKCSVSRSTVAEANEKRNWRIYADFVQVLIRKARLLYVNDDFGLEVENPVYALDTTTIDLCLSVFLGELPLCYTR